MNSGNESSVELTLFGLTDVGQVREHNEDNFQLTDLNTKAAIRSEETTLQLSPKGLLLAVCDGMGGAAAGEVASQLAVDIIAKQMTRATETTQRDELARNMVQAIEFAGGFIFEEARNDRSRRGMGTTSTVAVLNDSRVYLGQVGDSRAYLLRAGVLKLLTRDQSLVNQLIEAGQLTEEEAENFEHNNIILQALGTSETVQVDLTYADLQAGDQLMLCSDGLSGMIRDSEIQRIMLGSQTPEEACKKLIQSANQAGGHDNITVVVARVDQGPQRQESDFGYQKYTLPPPVVSETDAFADTGEHPAPDFSEVLQTAEPSAEAVNETRALRVSHTMVGMQSPLSGSSQHKEEFSDESITTMPGIGMVVDESEQATAPPQPAETTEEPVYLPTSQIPKGLFFFLVFVLVATTIVMLSLSKN